MAKFASRVASRVALPVILAGIFAVMIFIALEYDQLNFSSYIVLMLLGVYVFAFGFSTGQNFATPIKKLLEKAEELSKGDLNSRVYLETKDELAELAKVFNKIAGELQLSQEQEQNTEKSVDIKVRAKTQALEETIEALEQKVRNRTAELQKMIKSLEKFQGESTIKELELTNLKKQVSSLEGDIGKRSKVKVKLEKTEDI